MVYSLKPTVYRKITFVTAAFFLPLTFYLSLFTSAYAHILKTDGSIGAVLHIDPDDDPIVGQPAGFFFEFKDTQNKFKPLDCNCTFIINENGKQIYSQPLFQNNSTPSLDNASVSYTFQERNVYQIQVTGKPQTPGEFQNFTLSFDVRVERITNSPVLVSQSDSYSAGQTLNWYYLFGGLGLILAVLALIWWNKKDSQPKLNLEDQPGSSNQKSDMQ